MACTLMTLNNHDLNKFPKNVKIRKKHLRLVNYILLKKIVVKIDYGILLLINY